MRILQLNIPNVSEARTIFEELARLTPEERIEFIEALKNIEENF